MTKPAACGLTSTIHHPRSTLHHPMFSVSREIDFCYGHRLLDYQGKCRYLHGHNGKVLITIESSGLDERGMVFDFAEIKQVVQQWIEQNLDHRMILNRNDPIVAVLQEAGEPICLMDDNPTAENIAKLIFDFAAGERFPVVEVRFWETSRCFATYCRDETRACAAAPGTAGHQRRGRSAESSREEGPRNLRGARRSNDPTES